MAKEKHLTIRELTLGGLFAALIGAGAFIKITIPVEPTPMHVTLQWFVSVVGLLIYYGVGIAYYFFVCRFLISREVTWQILVFNCFLLTAPADLGLCLAAASAAAKLRGTVRRAMAEP